RWEAAGALAWLALAAAGAEPFRRCERAGLLGWSASSLMLDWHLGMVETEDGRPRALGPADALTLARAWLAPAAAREPSTVLLAAGFLTDVLDGPIARARAPTRLGRDLEGLADAYFGIAAAAGLLRARRLPRAVAALELGRVTVGLVGAMAVWFGRAAPPSGAALRAGRALTPVRAAGLLAASAERRRLGTALSAAGALASMGLAVRALLGRPHESG
ncbi:MAG: CDP-alcohol phosphatidyltransferase family protein, partial [Thermoleophilaceae bacterium]